MGEDIIFKRSTPAEGSDSKNAKDSNVKIERPWDAESTFDLASASGPLSSGQGAGSQPSISQRSPSKREQASPRNSPSSAGSGDQQQPNTASQPNKSISDSKNSNPASDKKRYEGETGREVELMLAYKAGDRSAFEKLYRSYQPKLYRFFFSATGSEAVALDLYQETWTKVIRARDSYEPKARFSTWIFAIARNCLNDFYRLTSRPINQPLGTDEAESALEQLAANETDSGERFSPDEMFSLAQRADLLQEALKLLPDQQKDAVLLRYAAGMSVAEIAVLNNEKPETIKSRLRYALPKLRSSLRLLERGL